MNRHRAGFTLLLTLLLLALAGTALGIAARRSHSQWIEADRAVRELQQRWAVATLEPVVRDASILLSEPVADLAAGSTDRPVASRRVSTRLGHLDIELTLADEQAKLPLPQLVQQFGDEEAARRLRRLLPADLATRVSLRPLDAFLAQLNSLPELPATPAFSAFSQVIDPPLGTQQSVHPVWLAQQHQRLASIVSLWGPGQLNLAACPPEILATTLAPDLDESRASQLAGTPLDQLEARLREMRVSDRVRQRIRSRLTDQSQTHSLWITLSDGRHRRDVMVISAGQPQSDREPTLRRLQW